METNFSYTERSFAFFSSDERRWINKVHKLKEKYPDQITILAEPENNDGCIYCKLPIEWLKLQPKKKCYLTDEQRSAIAARLRQK